MGVERVLVARHADRLSWGKSAPPTWPVEAEVLTERGRQQAVGLAAQLRASRIDALFSSPFVRCLQTAAPLAAERGLPIHVDRGFGEIMPTAWFRESPLPGLLWETTRDALPGVPKETLAADSGSPRPRFPDMEGAPRQGDTRQRERVVGRVGDALRRCFAAVSAVRIRFTQAPGSAI